MKVKSDKANGKSGIYIHIPFCRQKCLYCDFCSFPVASAESIASYVSALVDEIERNAEKYRRRAVDTVYFGGGTPTLLTPKQFEAILTSLGGVFDISHDSEITVECNPATANEQYFAELRSLGINRVSIGVQSANQNELSALGRIHSFGDAVKTVEDAKKAGFSNVSADIMFGIPEQTEESFLFTLESICKLDIPHISAYGLKIESGTPFAKNHKSLVLPDEDSEYNMYETAVKLLSQHGIERYEISNFAKKGYASRHNLKYWQYYDYIGFGVSAHSFVDGIRYSNSRDIKAYVNGLDIRDSFERIDNRAAENEYVMLGMRLSDGIDTTIFEKRFGESFESKFGPALSPFVKSGHVIFENGICRFSNTGFYVSNYILSSILDI